ncbi:HlyC/CorC family transporter [Clostridium folliculivorans]|uniref:Membrane protein n=1 Tax=Clostridium folliculivorans TaxID=2886038 RepID=A0A9W5Y640_9CLOT|nr:hemolysin family protein [Clostridium folliculivorans]GKU27341.1 membrane protein [Clostridium folliculivorans]GKU32192.1 membrane protein [Clostridium folliculivorans]
MNSSLTWDFIILVILLALSSFFSAAETALMSLSKIRIRHLVEENIKGAKLVEKLTEEPNKLLGSILIGNNVVNIGASALATTVTARLVKSDWGVAIATAVMTILILIFGEITPKSLAKQKSEAVSLRVIGPISLVVSILKPFVWIFNKIALFFIKILGGETTINQQFITEEELKTIVNVSEEEGVLEIEEKQMIYNVFEFGDLQVKDVMVQRIDIIAASVKVTYEEIIQIIKDEQFSRIPVYGETIDDILGVLNVKDLILAEDVNNNFSVKDYMRIPLYTFEFKKITELFSEMKKTRNHMAVVLDEYGGTVGIVTIEDLVEEIVGEIEDEYDDETDKHIEVVKEDEYIVDGSMRINDLNELIGTKIESEEFDSIGGFIIGQIGKMPEENEEVSYLNTRFVVEEVERNRIKKVRIYT